MVGSSVELQQVVLNLVLNAIDAMRDSDEGSRHLDTGTGLESEDFERVFQPFYTTKPEGLGMGLSICRSILEAHEGSIWITANPGPGVTVRCVVPAAADNQGC